MNTVTIINKKEFTRFGIKEELTIPRNKSLYVRSERQPYTKTVKLYNKHNELTGLETHLNDKEVIETIYKLKERTVIVILKDKEGKPYKGVAKCLISDTFDVQKGYSIAYLKAKVKKLNAKIKELSE